MKEIKGDLIKLALEGEFDAIAHGINCFNTQKKGLAPQMVKAFGTDKGYPGWFTMEGEMNKGKINKLGVIDATEFFVYRNEHDITLAKHSERYILRNFIEPNKRSNHGGKVIKESLWVINCYTQYEWKGMRNNISPFDYEAFTLCMKKINHTFKGRHIGLPLIGCGLAGAEFSKVKQIIEQELVDMEVTIVHYKK